MEPPPAEVDDDPTTRGNGLTRSIIARAPNIRRQEQRAAVSTAGHRR
jgi:hypothetical protein